MERKRGKREGGREERKDGGKESELGGVHVSERVGKKRRDEGSRERYEKREEGREGRGR